MKSLNMPENNEAKGFGGWLIVLGFSGLLSPIKIGYSLYKDYSDFVFKEEYRIILGTFESTFKASLYVECVTGIILFFASLYTVYLFFAKKRLFPKCCIVILELSVIFVLINILMNRFYNPMFVQDRGIVFEMSSELIKVGIWVPYLLFSKRVKATFIK